VTTALLFDRDHVDEIEDWSSQAAHLGRSSILWVDLDQPKRDRIREIVDALSLAPESEERLESGDRRPFFGDYGTYLHITAVVPARGDETAELVRVECVVAERWVVTVHEVPVEAFDEYRERAGGSGDVGRLDGLEFLANLLEWVLDAYLTAFEAVELALEEFDARAMEGPPASPDEELRRLVELRREIGRLRRALVSHRSLFLALARPELEAVTSSDHGERFASLRARLEEVVQAARDSRDSVVGSFDILIARNEQRTNEIVKVLTLGSMLLLPGALIAGIMGMNFKVGLFEETAYFWVVVGFILALAAATLVAARIRRWI
jgi:magnesium/cobalt transport protein CorA